MRLNTSSSLNRKEPSRMRSSVCVELFAALAQIVEQARVGVQLLVLILREIIGRRVVAQRVTRPT